MVMARELWIRKAIKPDGPWEWQVDASRNGQTILAKGPTHKQAWALAVRMAGQVERGE